MSDKNKNIMYYEIQKLKSTLIVGIISFVFFTVINCFFIFCVNAGSIISTVGFSLMSLLSFVLVLSYFNIRTIIDNKTGTVTYRNIFLKTKKCTYYEITSYKYIRSKNGSMILTIYKK